MFAVIYKMKKMKKQKHVDSNLFTYIHHLDKNKIQSTAAFFYQTVNIEIFKIIYQR